MEDGAASLAGKDCGALGNSRREAAETAMEEEGEESRGGELWQGGEEEEHDMGQDVVDEDVEEPDMDREAVDEDVEEPYMDHGAVDEDVEKGVGQDVVGTQEAVDGAEEDGAAEGEVHVADRGANP